MLTRRRLILKSVQLALTGSVLTYLPGCKLSSLNSGQVASSPLLDLLSGYSDVSYAGPKCVESLGEQSQAAPSVLQRDLLGSLEIKLKNMAGTFSTEEGLARLIQADFVNGNVHEVDGWQLSHTECQAAALAASLQGFLKPVKTELASPQEMDFVEIETWGPRKTMQGEPFNEQTDGHSGLWVKAKGIPPETVLVFSGKPQRSVIYEDHLTSGLRGDFMHSTITHPGVYTVELYDRGNNRIQRIGEFVVIERAEPIPFRDCRILAWGPNRAIRGEAFNAQPNGSSAFWILTNCAHANGIVFLDGKKLRTNIRPADGLITASLERGHELLPGRYSVQVHYDDGGEILDVGVLDVVQAEASAP